MASELQAKTRCDVFDADDDDDWLLGGGCQLEMHNFSKSQTKSHISIAQNPLGQAPGWPSILIQIRGLILSLVKRPIEYIFGFGAGPVGLKRACLNITVRSKYHHQDFVTMSWDTIPDLAVAFESQYVSSRYNRIAKVCRYALGKT